MLRNSVNWRSQVTTLTTIQPLTATTTTSTTTSVRVSGIALLRSGAIFQMKTYKRLFEQLCAIENLELAFKKARMHKTLKPYVMEFEKNLANNLQSLQNELASKIYAPLPLNEFILRDPKTRRISVSDFRDRVVHHAICNVLEPIFEKYFIYDSYANRKGKGNLKAIERFDYFKRKVSCNGRKIKRLQDDNYVQGYALKADIKHYFDTVSHKKLMGIISKRIADIDVRDLILKILNNYNAKQDGKACH